MRLIQSLKKINSFTTGSTDAHAAAQAGDIETLIEIVDKLGHLVNAKDENGWTPLHEGVRGGHTKVIEVLVEKGADINIRTGHGRGESPLHIAKQMHGINHPVTMLLSALGALDIGPDL